MKVGRGRNKGGGFEVATAKKLSLWLSYGKRDDLICRTAGSGAPTTNWYKKGVQKGIPGDLAPIDSLAFPFFEKYCIECKHWHNLDLVNFLLKKGDLFDAMLKIKEQSMQCKKYWWLIAKQNNRSELVFMSYVSQLRTAVPRHSLFNGEVLLYTLEDILDTDPGVLL